LERELAQGERTLATFKEPKHNSRIAIMTTSMARPSWFPSISMGLPWASGEEQMHRLLNVPSHDNPTSSLLTAQASFMLQNAPLLAVGTVDDQGRPWTTVWGGESGFSQPLGSSIIGTRTVVDRMNDPVVQALLGGQDDGEMVKSDGPGKMIGGLTIDLAARKRVKIFGRMVAAALDPMEQSADSHGHINNSTSGQLQLVVKIEQSLGMLSSELLPGRN
jgi:hypothetical protein